MSASRINTRPSPRAKDKSCCFSRGITCTTPGFKTRKTSRVAFWIVALPGDPPAIGHVVVENEHK